jgi:ribonucleoside-triphosphate reductase (formate)
MNLVKKIAENYHIPYYTMSPTYSICKEHGYLVGEQFTCPHCGQETEVYSRITGYYRPVRNWNDGKTEEYKNREKYNIEKSKLSHSVQCDKETGPKEEVKPTPKEILLFATKTCPNCKMAKMLLDKDQIKYTVIDAEEQRDLTEQYDITKAPTLIVPTEKGYDVYENASNIKGYIESLKKHGL